MANLIIKPTSGGSLILQDEGGTAANTIDASGNTQLAGTLGVTGATTMTGNVTMSGTANNVGTVTAGTIASGVTGGTGLQGITHASQWLLTTNFTNAADPITSNLVERAQPVGHGALGASMTIASGIFTFPVTGYWLIIYNYSGGDTNATLSINPILKTTTNNSTYANASQIQQGQYDGSGAVYFTGECKHIFDVTDTANCKCQFVIAGTDGANTTTFGNAAFMRTGFTFIRLGAT